MERLSLAMVRCLIFSMSIQGSCACRLRDRKERIRAKLARQISRYGNSLAAMPAIQVTRGKGGQLRINDGVARATRAALLRPQELVTVEVIHELPNLNGIHTPQVQDKLP